MSDFSQEQRLLSQFVLALAGRGFKVDMPWRPGPMSSGATSLGSPVAQVRVTADRGQWFVDVRPAVGAREWYDLEAWSACIGDSASFHVTERSLDTTDVAQALAASWRLQPQLAWLERHLHLIEAGCVAGASPKMLVCLRRRGQRG